MDDYLDLIAAPDDPRPGERFLWGRNGVIVVTVERGIGERIKFRADDGRLLQCGLSYFKRHAQPSEPQIEGDRK